jgi:diguanylate cyclase (GGDEF)-like protein
MDSVLRVQGRIGPRTLLMTTAALPLTGWTVHAITMHRRLTASSRDPLTGALRRDSFEPRIQRFLTRYGDQALLAVCDVNDFKQYNDRFGHDVGDLILARTAARVIQWAGSHGIVGRLGGDGGDEFIVATRIAPGRRTIRMTQLHQALREPITTEHNQVLPVAVAIGHATPDVIGTRDRSRLMRAADGAMYESKQTGAPVQATTEHADAVSINGRRAGRLGTAHPVVSAA